MRWGKTQPRPFALAVCFLVLGGMIGGDALLWAQTFRPRRRSRPARQVPPPEATQSPRPVVPATGVTVQDNALSLDVQDQELPAIIQAIATQGKIEVQNLDALPSIRVSLRFEGLPLVNGLKRLLQLADISGYALVTTVQNGQTSVQRILFLPPSTDDGRGTRVATQGRFGGGFRVGARPAPQEAEAPREQEDRPQETSENADGTVIDDLKKNSTARRLLVQLLHTNEQVRERAFERLVRLAEEDERQAELLEVLEPLLENLASESREDQEEARAQIRELLRN